MKRLKQLEQGMQSPAQILISILHSLTADDVAKDLEVTNIPANLRLWDVKGKDLKVHLDNHEFTAYISVTVKK